MALGDVAPKMYRLLYWRQKFIFSRVCGDQYFLEIGLLGPEIKTLAGALVPRTLDDSPMCSKSMHAAFSQTEPLLKLELFELPPCAAIHVGLYRAERLRVVVLIRTLNRTLRWLEVSFSESLAFPQLELSLGQPILGKTHNYWQLKLCVAFITCCHIGPRR